MGALTAVGRGRHLYHNNCFEGQKYWVVQILMPISFAERLILPEDVLISDVEGESVLLNVNSERYFGLDEVGTRMLSVLTTSNSIQTAYEALLEEYEVEDEKLRNDLADLVDRLVDQGLLEVALE
jgi:hypothetical protein